MTSQYYTRQFRNYLNRIVLIAITVAVLLLHHSINQCYAQPITQAPAIQDNNAQDQEGADLNANPQQPAPTGPHDITVAHEPTHAINPYAVTHIAVDAINPQPRWTLVQSNPNEPLVYPAAASSSRSSPNVQPIDSSFIVDFTSTPVSNAVKTFSAQCHTMNGDTVVIPYQQVFTPCAASIGSSSGEDSSGSNKVARHCFITTIHLNQMGNTLFNSVDMKTKCGNTLINEPSKEKHFSLNSYADGNYLIQIDSNLLDCTRQSNDDIVLLYAYRLFNSQNQLECTTPYKLTTFIQHDRNQ